MLQRGIKMNLYETFSIHSSKLFHSKELFHSSSLFLFMSSMSYLIQYNQLWPRVSNAACYFLFDEINLSTLILTILISIFHVFHRFVLSTLCNLTTAFVGRSDRNPPIIYPTSKHGAPILKCRVRVEITTLLLALATSVLNVRAIVRDEVGLKIYHPSDCY